MDPEIVLLRAVGLIAGVPAFLLGVFWLLDRLESWVLKPDERAEQVQELLVQVEAPDEVEQAVARLLAPVDSELANSHNPLTHMRARRSRSSDDGASAGPPLADGLRSRRRQEALAEAQEALREASGASAAALSASAAPEAGPQRPEDQAEQAATADARRASGP